MIPKRTIGARRVLAAVVTLIISPLALAQDARPFPNRELALEIFKELIEIDTTDSVGDTTAAAEAMARRLRAAGFPEEDVRVLGPHPRKGNLVARYRGSGARRPIVLLAHLDVVEAKREDWTVEPFAFLERDGYYYGRGTTDDKAQAAIWVANFIRYKREGFAPDRDLIVALTADEEGGDHNGVQWLLANHRELVDGAFCINEGGWGVLKDGRHLLNQVQLSEKVYLSFRLETTNAGGHSSLPVKDNAIYHLSRALVRIAEFDFPVQLNDGTRAFFERTAPIEGGQVGADMRAILRTPPDAEAVARLSQNAYTNALMRTTAVATMLEGGHAENALPQLAAAVVNARILPGESPDEVERTLLRVIADPRIRMTRMGEPTPSPPSPMDPEIIGAIENVTEQLWPGVPVVPTMVTGATDGLYFRNAGIPTYGVSGLFTDIDDVRAHGRDERIGVESFHDGLEFLYRLVKLLASP
jgi:acetylornithine deacetylase/succinyl-diaminopimelate desuccinylase-like protein